MNNEFFQPGYPVFEYRLVIRPNEAMRKRLDHLRETCREKYGWTMRNNAFNHIPVVHFFQFAYLEERMLDGLRQVINSMPPFKMEWQQFSASFNHQAIYLPALSQTGFDFVIKNISQHRRLLKAGTQQPQFESNAHLVVGQRLNERQFSQAWSHLSNRKFQASTVVDSLLLLKRPQGAQAWQIANRFELLNLPVFSRQGVLFA